MLRNIAFTALTCSIFASAQSAMAQTACAPRDQMIAKLQSSYGEDRMGAGLRGEASLFEVWASADSGTWTILVTDTEGVSCIMASGDTWLDMPTVPAALGAPA